jgi:hypothetical protein
LLSRRRGCRLDTQREVYDSEICDFTQQRFHGRDGWHLASVTRVPGETREPLVLAAPGTERCQRVLALIASQAAAAGALALGSLWRRLDLRY